MAKPWQTFRRSLPQPTMAVNAQDNWFERLARLGYASRGVVYLVLGGLAVMAAVGAGGAVTGTEGVFAEILSQPFGRVLLAIVALGLACFAAWRVVQSLLDADGQGTEGKALLVRAALGVSAVVNAALAVTAISLALGLGSAGNDNSSAQGWTQSLMQAPLGRWLVAAAGLAIAGTGLALGWKGWNGWKGEVVKRLGLTFEQRRWAVPMGRAGYLARGVVFVLVGGFLVVAAVQADPQEARGLSGALRALEQQAYGWVLFGLTALGLLAFGAFQLVVAVFRRIAAPDLGRAARQIAQAGSPR